MEALGGGWKAMLGVRARQEKECSIDQSLTECLPSFNPGHEALSSNMVGI